MPPALGPEMTLSPGVWLGLQTTEARAPGTWVWPRPSSSPSREGPGREVLLSAHGQVWGGPRTDPPPRTGCSEVHPRPSQVGGLRVRTRTLTWPEPPARSQAGGWGQQAQRAGEQKPRRAAEPGQPMAAPRGLWSLLEGPKEPQGRQSSYLALSLRRSPHQNKRPCPQHLHCCREGDQGCTPWPLRRRRHPGGQPWRLPTPWRGQTSSVVARSLTQHLTGAGPGCGPQIRVCEQCRQQGRTALS